MIKCNNEFFWPLMYCRWLFSSAIVTNYFNTFKICWKFWKPYVKLLQYQGEMPPAILHSLLLAKKIHWYITHGYSYLILIIIKHPVFVNKYFSFSLKIWKWAQWISSFRKYRRRKITIFWHLTYCIKINFGQNFRLKPKSMIRFRFRQDRNRNL